MQKTLWGKLLKLLLNSNPFILPAFSSHLTKNKKNGTAALPFNNSLKSINLIQKFVLNFAESGFVSKYRILPNQCIVSTNAAFAQSKISTILPPLTN